VKAHLLSTGPRLSRRSFWEGDLFTVDDSEVSEIKKRVAAHYEPVKHTWSPPNN